MSRSVVSEILSWYGSDNPGTLTNLARLFNHGKLAGRGKLVILPVDQGFEHGPARSFGPNPAVYSKIRELAEQAKKAGLAVVIWSYPRGSGISKEGETAIDVCGYAAHIAAQLGAHIIKVKLPSAHIEQEAARKVYESTRIPLGTLAERVQHVVQCCFGGRRVVIFSGGAADTDQNVLEEIRAIRAGGGFGSIIGRNSFQRPRDAALKLLSTIIGIYAGEIQ
jgi:fructose-bisphosphate aldolase, class I